MPFNAIADRIAGLLQRVDRIRTGCDGQNNSDGAVSIAKNRAFHFYF
jgi:hypothetical protein